MMRSVIHKGELVCFDDEGRTNEQAIEVLRGMRDLSPFAADLVAKAPRLTEKQWSWVHFLAVEAGKRERAHGASSGMELPRLYQLLTTVDLQRPCIELGIFGVNVRCKLTKRRDRVAIVVNNAYLARIDAGGKVSLVTGDPLDDRARATLALMEIDPVGAATLHGKVTGLCCFCQRRLETAESVTAGYGPVCAEKWGLPWGHVSPSTLIDEVRDRIARLFPQVG